MLYNLNEYRKQNKELKRTYKKIIYVESVLLFYDII